MSRRLVIASVTAALVAVSPALGADGVIGTFAGSVQGFAGDGGPATQALLDNPQGMALMPDGSVLIADSQNQRIRKVAPDGTITTAAGTGLSPGFSGDGGPATAAVFDTPTDVLTAPDGGYWIADSGNHRVRRVAPDGTITTIAGSSTGPGLGGDGGPATSARLNTPRELTLMPDGSLLVADTGNHRIRRIAAGSITTVAGTNQGLAGDGGPATAGQLNAPTGTAATVDGGFLIADTGNSRVRKVSATGIISTVAGSSAGFAGDGSLASQAQLAAPADVAALGPNGGYLVIDRDNNRVRRVTPLGTIFTIAGGPPGLGGDGGPASAGLLRTPAALQFAPGGGILVGDTGNSRVRRLTDVGQLPLPQLVRSMGVNPVSGTVAVQPRTLDALIPLNEPDLAPNLSNVDARTGSLDLTVQNRSGALRTATVAGGSFLADQPVAGKIIANLRLNEPLTCSRSSVRTKTTHAVKRTRRLRIKVKGRFRTIGRYASAVASGTEWTIVDGCDRTTIRVTEGTVIFRNLRTGKTINVRAGQTRTVLARSR